MDPSSASASRAAYGGWSSLPRHNVPRIASQYLTFAAALTSTWTGIRIAGINLVDYLLVAAVFFALVTAAGSGRRLPIYAWAVLPPVALLVIALIGSLVRGDLLWASRVAYKWVQGSAVGAEYGGALPLIARMALSLTAVAILVVGITDNMPGRNALVENIVRTWAVGAAISASYGVIEHVSGSPTLSHLPFLYQYISHTRVAGLANHPNSFGQTISVALPVLIYMAITTRGLTRIVMSLLLPISMYAIFLSGSRAALLCGALIAIATSGFFANRQRKIHIWLPPVAILIVMLVMFVMPAVLDDSRFFDKSGQASNAARIANLKEAIELFGANPILGSGVGSWIGEMVPLIVLTAGGILYFVVFYGCLAYPLFKPPRGSGSVFISILVISAVGVIAFGLLNNGIAERYLYWPFAALFALKLADTRTCAAPPNGNRSASLRSVTVGSGDADFRAAGR